MIDVFCSTWKMCFTVTFAICGRCLTHLRINLIQKASKKWHKCNPCKTFSSQSRHVWDLSMYISIISEHLTVTKIGCCYPNAIHFLEPLDTAEFIRILPCAWIESIASASCCDLLMKVITHRDKFKSCHYCLLICFSMCADSFLKM